MELEIALASASLFALLFLSLIETAFSELSDVGLRRMVADAEEERPGSLSEFLREILDNRPRFRFTLTVTLLILVVAISVLVTSITNQLLYSPSETLSYTRFLLIAFAVGLASNALARQIIPRLAAAHRPEATLYKLLPALRFVYRPLTIIAFTWHRSFDRARRAEREQAEGNSNAEEETDGDDLQALIDVGEEEGILEEEEGELIQSIIEFGDTRVSEVMTPRTDVVALQVTSTVREARDLVINSKYSRLPVYREQIDNVEGLIYVRDLMTCWAERREDEPIEPLVRPVFFVPETKAVDELLKEMQKTHVQLAMVIDEYGGVAGLVTVEDILEEIVGEIEDEDTAEDEVIEIVEAGEGYYEVLGSTEVGKIERLFDFEIEDDDFTTIAGLVIGESGRVPPAGTHVSLRGLDVEVLESDERRIGRLRLRRAIVNGAEQTNRE